MRDLILLNKSTWISLGIYGAALETLRWFVFSVALSFFFFSFFLWHFLRFFVVSAPAQCALADDAASPSYLHPSGVVVERLDEGFVG